jgi:hypothetical protein
MRVRAAHVDALMAAWEAAIQAEDVDAIVSSPTSPCWRPATWPPRGAQRTGHGRDGVGVRGAAAGRKRDVPPGLGRGVARRPARRGGRRRVPAAAVLYDGLQLEEADRFVTAAGQLAARVGDHGRVRDRTRLVGYQLAMARSDWRAAIAAIPRGRRRRAGTALSIRPLPARCPGSPVPVSTLTPRSDTCGEARRSLPPPAVPAVAATWRWRPPRCSPDSTGARTPTKPGALGRARPPVVRRERVAPAPHGCPAGRGRRVGRRRSAGTDRAGRRGRRAGPGVPRAVDGSRHRSLPRLVGPSTAAAPIVGPPSAPRRRARTRSGAWPTRPARHRPASVARGPTASPTAA